MYAEDDIVRLRWVAVDRRRITRLDSIEFKLRPQAFPSADGSQDTQKWEDGHVAGVSRMGLIDDQLIRWIDINKRNEVIERS